jgi:hypothetical protein
MMLLLMSYLYILCYKAHKILLKKIIYHSWPDSVYGGNIWTEYIEVCKNPCDLSQTV